MSQFEKSLKELGVTVIHAYSPQVKGRVERLFGTFQDRVIKEMRLAGIRNQDEGNEFLESDLPDYNRRFRVSPDQDTDLHRPFKDRRKLDRILSIRSLRVLRNDFTIAHNKRLYQIKDTIRDKKVAVEERTDGSMLILHNGQRLRYQEITTRPKKEHDCSVKLHKTWARGKPTRVHPWRAPLNMEQKARVSTIP
jgi:hypothetical protein